MVTHRPIDKPRVKMKLQNRSYCFVIAALLVTAVVVLVAYDISKITTGGVIGETDLHVTFFYADEPRNVAIATAWPSELESCKQGVDTITWQHRLPSISGKSPQWIERNVVIEGTRKWTRLGRTLEESIPDYFVIAYDAADGNRILKAFPMPKNKDMVSPLRVEVNDLTRKGCVIITPNEVAP